ncbi:MAG: DUF86 domain-containing protein [Dictyoglomaceae bacterium]|nr:DUF86 domain-containing protein [Dictyoglomaceae bacterium]
MTFDKDLIRENLIELRNVTTELEKYRDIKEEDFTNNLSLRWIIERGLLAGINIILDVGNHILASLYQIYPKTYEYVLKEMYLNKIISEELYQKIKGMGSFRNVLVNEYIKLDPRKVFCNFHLFLEIISMFIEEILKLLDK